MTARYGISLLLIMVSEQFISVIFTGFGNKDEESTRTSLTRNSKIDISDNKVFEKEKVLPMVNMFLSIEIIMTFYVWRLWNYV